MKIYLFNCYHNGDLYFNQSIIRNICKNNQQYEFTMFCKYNSFIFSEIPNLHIDIGDSINYFIEKSNECFFLTDNNILAINLWIFPLSKYHPSSSHSEIECNIKNYVDTFQKLLIDIQHKYNITLCIDNFTIETYIPVLPYVNLDDFEVWNNNRDPTKQLVLYYNYRPFSGQKVSINNHDMCILGLAKMCTNTIFLIADLSDNLANEIKINNINNIIDCKTQFNCIPTKTCENICKIQKIAEKCKYSIHFDIGACFYYLNNAILSNTTNITLHLGHSDFIYNNITKDFPTVQSKVRYIHSENDIDAYLKLEDIIIC
jgi:hypothetical protein